jgi:uncharacterized membrane protein YphA (DoxX/SURF4 family)
MWDSRRQLGTFAVVALVLLRLATGWHFYREGSAKLVYDQPEQRFDVDFSADGFLSQAKGPLAELYQSYLPDGHDWKAMLARPRQDGPLNASEVAADAEWQIAFNDEKAKADAAKQPPPVDFKPSLPYARWAKRVTDDWQQTLDRVSGLPGVTDEQRTAMRAALAARKKQLAEYLETQAEPILEYQHELWRLKELQKKAEAGTETEGVPFVEQQVATALAKSSRDPLTWVRQVNTFDQDYVSDLRAILRANEATATAADDALRTSQERQLATVNLAVTILTVSVGVCLLLGLFTRLAAVAGALFLLSVIASQPPWVTGAAPTYYQTVEFAGLLVLAGTGAGRWAGLDYFGYLLFGRRQRGEAAGG